MISLIHQLGDDVSMSDILILSPKRFTFSPPSNGLDLLARRLFGAAKYTNTALYHLTANREMHPPRVGCVCNVYVDAIND